MCLAMRKIFLFESFMELFNNSFIHPNLYRVCYSQLVYIYPFCTHIVCIWTMNCIWEPVSTPQECATEYGFKLSQFNSCQNTKSHWHISNVMGVSALLKAIDCKIFETKQKLLRPFCCEHKYILCVFLYTVRDG